MGALVFPAEGFSWVSVKRLLNAFYLSENVPMPR